MNLGQIRAEVQARGYDYVAAARINDWIKQSYRLVCAMEPWSFLESEVTGAAPLTITDLSQVLYVVSGAQTLRAMDYRDIRDQDPGLDDVGDPVSWYLKNNEINVWPTSNNEVWVRYLRTPPALSNDSATPLIPDAFQEILIDMAVVRGLKDNDEYEQASNLQVLVDGSIQAMKDALIVRNYQNPTQIVQSRPNEDYIS